MAVASLPQVIEQFVATNNEHDVDGMLATFATDAVVDDDGQTLTTPTEIRSWIMSHLIDPQIVVTPTSYEGDRMIASSSGNFPGSPQAFAFDFETKDDLITRLSIDVA